MNPITRLKCAVRDIMRRRDAGPTPAGCQVRLMPGNAGTSSTSPVSAGHR